MSKRDDPTLTLVAGWESLAVDLRRHIQKTGEDMPSLRQAFKNGAAFLYARGYTRGQEVLEDFAADQVAAMQAIKPIIDYNLRIHPEWTQQHADCVFAGGFAVCVLALGGRSLPEIEQEIAAFEVNVP
jgi:hypothetical protein